MELATVQTVIETTPKGANIILEWERAAKTLKTCTDSIRKHVRMVGRLGIEYDNMKAVKEGRASGELPAKNAGLPWGNWAVYPYLIEHKGVYYVRLYNGTSDRVHPQTKWFRNATEVPYESVECELLASEKREEHGECFCCKVADLIRIHNENEWLLHFLEDSGISAADQHELETVELE